MSDIVYSTLNATSKPENRLRAIKLYCEGVREDFPQAATWMNNILILAGFEQIVAEHDVTITSATTAAKAHG